MRQFIWPVRVYYEDTDAGGVVYHANYLNFLERARTEMLRAHGMELPELRLKNEMVFVVRSVNMEYLKPAVFNDLLTIKTEISLLRKVSLTFEQTILRDENVLCQAQVYVACVDAKTMRPKVIPDNLIAEFQ